ncbi:unnamed protein product [Pleuronectes platessa]|uniref:Uncharacterized protein n=1 Tax=Pleuronectes platessa TaxID=8262 RepID=A0A9N7ZBP1_PLEPL|nr:unnamed protein product [Pleuronectes platessa]
MAVMGLWVVEVRRAKEREGRGANGSYIEYQCYPGRSSACHTPCPCGFCDDSTDSDATDNLHFHICLGETVVRGDTGGDVVQLIGLQSDKTVGKPAVQHLQAEKKQEKSHMGINLSKRVKQNTETSIFIFIKKPHLTAV